MNDAVALVFQVLALVLLIAAIAAALEAIMSRSLLAMCGHLTAAGALVATVVLLLRGGDGALAAALFAAAWAPINLLGAVLLSARAAKPWRSVRAWLSALAAAAAAMALLWPLSEMPAAASASTMATAGLGFWIAPVIAAAAAACVGLLGYGERGMFGRRA
jgi:hypothetical protein